MGLFVGWVAAAHGLVQMGVPAICTVRQPKGGAACLESSTDSDTGSGRQMPSRAQLERTPEASKTKQKKRSAQGSMGRFFCINPNLTIPGDDVVPLNSLKVHPITLGITTGDS